MANTLQNINSGYNPNVNLLQGVGNYSGTVNSPGVGPYGSGPGGVPSIYATPGNQPTSGGTIGGIINSSLGQGQNAYNQAQPLINNVAGNLTNNPLQNLLLTGGTNNQLLMGYLNSAGINTTPNQVGGPGAVPGTVGAGTSALPGDRNAQLTVPPGTPQPVSNGLGVTISANQMSNLTPEQQTQLNGYLATSTQQQQTALSSFKSQMESRFGAGNIDPSAAAAGEALITATYQAQADQQVASYNNSADAAKTAALNNLLTAGTAQENATQNQSLSLINQLLSENQSGQSLAQSGAAINAGDYQAGVQNSNSGFNSLISALSGAAPEIGSALGSAFA